MSSNANSTFFILHSSFYIKKIIPNFFEKNYRLLSVVC